MFMLTPCDVTSYSERDLAFAALGESNNNTFSSLQRRPPLWSVISYLCDRVLGNRVIFTNTFVDYSRVISLSGNPGGSLVTLPTVILTDVYVGEETVCSSTKNS